MPDDVCHQYKEDQNSGAMQHTVRSSSGAVVTRRVYVRKRKTAKRGPDYIAFKATMAAAVEDIKLEIRDQHQQTRAEVQTARRDILATIKSSPVEFVKLISEFGGLFMTFSLAVRFLLKIELVNPAFAFFMLFAFGLYWVMARVKQESEKRGE